MPKRWGYKDGEAKIFELTEHDGHLPAGWADSPSSPSVDDQGNADKSVADSPSSPSVSPSPAKKRKK
jgi:hypothetical protein